MTTLLRFLPTNWEQVGTVFNTLKTTEHIRDPPASQFKRTDDRGNTYYRKIDSLWGDKVYEPTIVQGLQTNATNMFSARQSQTWTGSKELNFKTGLFSSIFLTNLRLSPDFKGFYTEVIYNPLLDKGEGNIVWMDWCSKNDCKFADKPGNLAVKNLPLWCSLMGYVDYCSKYYNDPGLEKEARVTIISPYTEPPMLDKADPTQGFVPYDYNFGRGVMPNGNGYIPVAYRFKWYICMFHQKNFINDIVSSGPFVYHGELKSVTLTTKYTFNFLLGGNPILQQTVKDPCKQPTFDIPAVGGLPRPIQIIDPKYVDEGTVFHAFDIRRGFFGAEAIKRVREKQGDALFYPTGAKRPKIEVPAIAGGDSDLQVRKQWPWQEDSQEEAQSEAEVPEVQTEQEIQEQLRKQFLEQRALRCGLQHVVQQLVKTQYHLHAPIIH